MATKMIPVNQDVKVWQSGEDAPNTPLAEQLQAAFVEFRKGNGTGNRRRKNRRSKQK